MSIDNVNSISEMKDFLEGLEHNFVEVGKFGNREVVLNKGEKNEERISVDKLAKKTLELSKGVEGGRDDLKEIAVGLRSLSGRLVLEPVNKQSVKSMVGATAKVVMGLFSQEIFLRHLGKLEDRAGIKSEEKSAPHLAENMKGTSIKVEILAKELEGIGAKMKEGEKLDSLEKWQGRIVDNNYKYIESSPRHVWQPIFSHIKELWYRRKAGKVLEEIAKEESRIEREVEHPSWKPEVQVLSDWEVMSVEEKLEKEEVETAKIKRAEVKLQEGFRGTPKEFIGKWMFDGLEKGKLDITHPGGKRVKLKIENAGPNYMGESTEPVEMAILDEIKKNTVFSLKIGGKIEEFTDTEDLVDALYDLEEDGNLDESLQVQVSYGGQQYAMAVRDEEGEVLEMDGIDNLLSDQIEFNAVLKNRSG